MVNENFVLVPFVIQEILRSAYKYEEKTDIIEEEIELTKLFPFKISVQQGRNTLVVYKEAEAEEGRKGRLGFHINPYAFDSGDEKDLFRYLRDVLDKDETIKDVYFTGARVCGTQAGLTSILNIGAQSKESGTIFSPDFLIETTKRFIVVEAKGSDEKLTTKQTRNHTKARLSISQTRFWQKKLASMSSRV